MPLGCTRFMEMEGIGFIYYLPQVKPTLFFCFLVILLLENIKPMGWLPDVTDH
jgi:hypothetical protein